MTTKLTRSGVSVWVAAIAALAGLILYLVTSVTGFLAGSAMSPLPIVCTVLALALAAVLLFAPDRLGPVLLDLAVVAAALLIIASFALFALGRVSLVADVYFIPVNYPQSEVTALNLSFAGLACYLVAIAAGIAASFSGKLSKD